MSNDAKAALHIHTVANGYLVYVGNTYEREGSCPYVFESLAGLLAWMKERLT